MKNISIKQYAEKIDAMGKNELSQFVRDTHMVKHEVDRDVFAKLMNMCDVRMMNLQENTTLNAMCVMSDIDYDN